MEGTGKYCVRCGAELVKPQEEFDLCDEMETEQYVCPNCGAYHTITLMPEDERDCYPMYNKDIKDGVEDCYHGYPGECFNCGHHLVWSSDFMRSEVWGDVETDENGEPILEKDSLATYLTCPYCGASIEVVDVKTDEETNYPYYRERYKTRQEAESDSES